MLDVRLLLLACALTACASPGPRPHWLRIADGAGDLPSLNSHLVLSATMDHIAALTQGYFVRYDRNAKPVPDLATEIPTMRNGGISKDGLRITWHLRRGVAWSDGAPFDARDVVFSTRAILNPANNEAGGTQGWDAIKAIETPDPYTVIYRLKRPYGALVSMMFVTIGGGPSLLPAHLLQALPNINEAPFNARPIGLGPFRITAWKRGDAVEMDANPYYWRGKPKLEHITFSFVGSRETLSAQMRSGAIDLWPLVPPTYVPQIAATSGLRVDRTPSLRTTHIDFMMTPGAVATKPVREAFRLAIDRRRIIDTIEFGNGLLTDAIVWPYNPVVRDDPAAISPDLRRAKALLRGQKITLSLIYQAGAADLDRIVEFVRAQLAPAGIALETRTYSHALLFAPDGPIAHGRFDAVLYSSTLTSVPDLASNFDCLQVPPHGENFNHWCDRRLDAPILTLRSAYDAAEIGPAFAAINRLFVSEIPSIQLFAWKGGYAMSDRVTGYRPNRLSSFDDMLEVDTR